MKAGNNKRWEKVKKIWYIIDQLRGESGCPWDKKQTPETVQTYLIEEAHEAAASVRGGNAKEVAEELGDLLFMVFFMVHLYEEKGAFSLEEISDVVCRKMIRRHPHVFGDVSVGSIEEIRDNWEKIKAQERLEKKKDSEDIPASLPALIRAYRVLSRHAKNNPSLDDVHEVARRLSVSVNKIVASVESKGTLTQKMFGEALMLLANLARLKGYRPEDCLHKYLEEPL